MNDIDKKYFNICVVGKGKEFFEPLLKEEQSAFKEKDLYFGISEGFSAPEITNVIISIGGSVVAGLSTYYISKLIDKIFNIKNNARKSGQEFNIQINIEINNSYYTSSEPSEVKKFIKENERS